jgi:hypothetical protein
MSRSKISSTNELAFGISQEDQHIGRSLWARRSAYPVYYFGFPTRFARNWARRSH